jgi:hypothetical protein
MKLFGRAAPALIEVPAAELKAGQRLAAGIYQEFGMSNVSRHGETISEVDTDTSEGLVYVISEKKPGWSWTLQPGKTVMIEEQNS